MANNKHIKFDDGLDGFDGLDDWGDGGWDDLSESKDTRAPITQFAGGFIDGAKDTLMDPSTQLRFLKKALPEGYEKAIDMAEDTAAFGQSLYDTALSEIKPEIREFKRSMRRIIPEDPKFLPKSISAKINKFLEDDEKSQHVSEKDTQETLIAGTLGEIFNTQQGVEQHRREEDQAKDRLDSIISKKRFKGQIEQTMAIRAGIERLVGYQDNVTIRYQKKSLELQLRHLYTSKKLLDTMQQFTQQQYSANKLLIKNTGLPDMVKVKDSELAHQMMKQRMFSDVGNYFKGKMGGGTMDDLKAHLDGSVDRIKDHLKNKVQEFAQNTAMMMQNVSMAGDAAESLDDAAGMGASRHEMIGGLAGGVAADFLSSAAAPHVRKLMEKFPKLRGQSAYLMRTLSEVPEMINEFGHGEEDLDDEEFIRNMTDDDNQDQTTWGKIKRGAKKAGGALYTGVKETAREGAGTYHRSDVVRKDLSEDLDSVAQFNLRSQLALTEVIPGWLGKMSHTLDKMESGKKDVNKQQYDHATGEFKDVKEISKRITDSVFDPEKIKAIKQSSAELIDQVDPQGELPPEIRTKLVKFLMERASQGKRFNISHLTKDKAYAKMFNEADAAKLAKHMATRYGYDPEKGIHEHASDEEMQLKLGGTAKAFRNMREQFPNIRKQVVDHAMLGNYEALLGTDLTERKGTTQVLRFEDIVSRMMDQADAGKGTGSAIAGSMRPDGGAGGHDPFVGPQPEGMFARFKRSDAYKGMRDRYDEMRGKVKGEFNERTGGTENIRRKAEDLGTDFRTQAQDRMDQARGKVDELRGVSSDASFMGPMPRGLGSVIRDRLNDPELGAQLRSEAQKIMRKVDPRNFVPEEVKTQINDYIAECKDKGREIDLSTIRNMTREYTSRGKERLAQVNPFGGGSDPSAAEAILGTQATQTGRAVETQTQQAASISPGQLEDLLRELTDKLIDTVTNSSAKQSTAEAELRLQEIRELISIQLQMMEAGLGGGGGGTAGPRSTLGMLGDLTARWGKRGLKAGGMFAGHIKRNMQRVNSLLGKGLKFGVKAGGLAGKMTFGLGSALKKRYVEFKNRVADIYVVGRQGPALLMSRIVAGDYIDVKTKKTIASVKDITGQVVDREGNVCITEEEFARGLYTRTGRSLIGKVLGAVRGQFNLTSKALAGFFNIGKTMVRSVVTHVGFYSDVYVQGEETPRLLATILRAGGYFLKEKKKVVNSYKDLIGTIVDAEGNVRLSADDIHKGIHDKYGRPLKTILGRLIGTGIKLGRMAFGAAKAAFGAGKRALQAGAAFVGDAASSIMGGSLKDFSLFGGSKKTVSELQRIYNLLDERLPGRKRKGPKPKGVTDTDGDGIRDGSWRDILKRRKKPELMGPPAPKAAAAAKGLGIGGLITAALGMLGGMGKTLFDSLGFLKSIAKGVWNVGKVVGKLGGFLGRTLMGKGLAGKVLKGGLKTAWNVAKFGARALPWLARGAMMVGGGILSSPVLVGALVVGTVAWLGYKAYKHLTKKDNWMTQVRYAGYGVDPKDEDKAAAIANFESQLIKMTTVDKNGTATIGKTGKADKFADLFGFKEDDEDKRREFETWFVRRFKPIFLSWMSVHYLLTGKTDIQTAEELKVAQKLELLSRTTFKPDVDSPYTEGASPWGDGTKMQFNINQMDKLVKTARSALEKSKDAEKAAADKAKEKLAAPPPKKDFSVTDRLAEVDAFRKKQAAEAAAKKKAEDALKPKEEPGFFDKLSNFFNNPDAKGGQDANGLMKGPVVPGGPVGRAVTHPGNGTGGSINDLPMPSAGKGKGAVEALIVSAAKMVGVDPSLMMTMANIESGFDPNAKAPTSSAAGLFQFINDTWNEMLSRYGAKYGIGSGATQYDARANALMGAEFLKQNTVALQKTLKRPATDTEAYLAHFMGLGGSKSPGARQLLSMDPNANAVVAFPAAANANTSIFYNKNKTARTVAEVIADIESRVKLKRVVAGAGTVPPAVAATTPTTGSATTPALAAPPAAAPTKTAPVPKPTTTPVVPATTTPKAAPSTAATAATQSGNASTATQTAVATTAATSAAVSENTAANVQQKAVAKESSQSLSSATEIMRKSLEVAMSMDRTLLAVKDGMDQVAANTKFLVQYDDKDKPAGSTASNQSTRQAPRSKDARTSSINLDSRG